MSGEKGSFGDLSDQPSTSSGKGLKRAKDAAAPGNEHKKKLEYTDRELATHIQSANKSNSSELERVNESNFVLLKVLGVGGVGKVFLVRKLTGADKDKLYAMKVQEKIKTMRGRKIAKHTKWERELLETIGDTPFLIKLNYAFQTKAKLYLVLNYVAGGDLGSHLRRKKHFSEDEVRFYIGEIILALQNLHKIGIIYRDIKIENILLDEFGHIVLTDFGLSKQIGIGNKTNTFCGTMDYIAPEVAKCGFPEIEDIAAEVSNILGYDFSADWWSIGILTYQLLIGSLPFSMTTRTDYLRVMAEKIITTSLSLPESLGEKPANFISNLIMKDPRKRLGHGKEDAEELKRHPFFENLDWDKLARKEISVPFKPIIENELDVSNFNPVYTKLPPNESPAAVPANFDKLFIGYTFTAPETSL